MIGKSLLRVVALAATLGQLQQLPAALACAAHHARPAAASHCGTMPVTGGPAVVAAHDAGLGSCLGMPCMAQAPADPGVVSVAAVQPGAAAPAAAALPSVTSVTSSPPSPPPQA